LIDDDSNSDLVSKLCVGRMLTMVCDAFSYYGFEWSVDAFCFECFGFV